ncbi:MAG: glycosyltransferase [Oscillospiraceae bacterium]|nr:glycosyltransferase [Oscillospiraceae bacterium]
MHILYLISYAGRAGTEKYVEDLMRLFAAQGHRCSLAYSVPGPLSEKAAASGFGTFRLDMAPRRILAAGRELAAYCRRHRVDVIHAQYPRENAAALLWRLFRPRTAVVFTVHLSLRQGPRWRLLNRLLTPFDRAVIALYGDGAALLRRNGVCAGRIRVIPNGLKTLPLPPRQNVLREEYSLPEDCFVFLSLCRFAPEKGLDCLLDALDRLRSLTDRPFCCAVAGEGELFEEVRSRAEALGLTGQVRLLGYRADTRSLLRSADAYVSSALRGEAMSFSILEAMSCGLPLAVTDVGAGRELAAGCGLVSAPGDAAQLAENLRRLIEDDGLRAAFAGESRRRAAEEYDLRLQAKKLAALYDPEVK